MKKHKPLNILILSWRGPGHPHEGGAEIVTHEYAKGWVNAGHRVTLFTSTFPGAGKSEVKDGVKIIRDGNQILSVHIKAFFWYLFKNTEYFDLVIDQFHGIPFFTPLYMKTRILAFIHEVTKDVWALNPLPKPVNYVPMIIGRIFEPFVFKFIYHRVPFLTVSNSTKKELIEWGIPENAITVISNGILLPEIGKIAREKVPTITFLGALAKDKGIEDAIEAFYLIRQSVRNARFWIVGRSDERYLKFLKNKVKKLGLGSQVRFYGYVNEKRKFEILQRCHLLINPSIREGWGLTVIEGAAMGTPTIGFNSPGLRDSIKNRETGMLTKFNNSVEIARLSILLLENKKLYQKISSGAKKFSLNFRWNNSVRKSLDLIYILLDLDRVRT